jgi:hypothetical protein
MAFSSFQAKKKNPHKQENKNAKRGGSLPFFSHFYIWDETLFLHSLLHVPSTLSSPLSSSLVSCIFSKLYVIQAWELS